MNTEIHITFMRHGRSRADDEEVHEGRYDSPLTEVGRAQAQARGQAWLEKGVTFDRIIASTLQRALETAQILGAILDVPVESDPDWMEMDNGPLAGIRWDMARAQFPQPAFRNPYETFWGTGEGSWDVYMRAARAVQNMIRRGPGRYLVVAHGGILNDALRTIIGAGPTVNSQGVWFAFDDTGYIQTIYNPAQHQWLIEEFAPQ
jgi:2,3-bisphosphoglycerate-dependent phosphoglycerate mutase